MLFSLLPLAQKIQGEAPGESPDKKCFLSCGVSSGRRDHVPSSPSSETGGEKEQDYDCYCLPFKGLWRGSRHPHSGTYKFLGKLFTEWGTRQGFPLFIPVYFYMLEILAYQRVEFILLRRPESLFLWESSANNYLRRESKVLLFYGIFKKLL